MSFFDDLKQRKIFQWAVAYLAAAWVLVQLIDVLGARWGVSDSAARVIDIVLIVGCFVTLVVAWYHGDQGKQRVSGPELLIITGLFAVGGLALGMLGMDTERSPRIFLSEAPIASDEEPWIAVLPFEALTEDPELENFAGGLTSAGLLAVQDELTDRIVATVADPAGVVVRTLAAPADRKAPEDLTPYEAVLRYFLFQQRISAEDHFITRTALERAVELDPGYADAWTSLSLIYQQEYMNNLNPLPDSLERALAAAQRAVDLDPASSRAQFAMAQARYFLKDVSSFHVHAERAIELNPHHAGWYYFNTFFNEYRQHRYAEALAIAQKINMPEYWATPMVLAITHAQLGNEAQARNAAEEVLRIWPAFEQEYYQQGLVNWIFGQPELIEHINEGLRNAGIDLLVTETTIR